MKNELRQIINVLKFPYCNSVKWSILQKWSQTVDLIHTYLARRRWYDTNWSDFMKITHEQHISCRITTFAGSICWLYEWDWNEHSQSRHLLVLLQKKDDVIREVPRFSETQYHTEKIERRWHFKEDTVIRAYFAKSGKNIHFIPEHDDLDHVICDLDGTDGHDDEIYDIRFSQITKNISSSEKLTWRSIRNQILCILWDIINVGFSIFLRHVRMFFHQVSWHLSHSQNQKVNLHKKMIHYIPVKFHWMKSEGSWYSIVFGQIFIWEICFLAKSTYQSYRMTT